MLARASIDKMFQLCSLPLFSMLTYSLTHSLTPLDHWSYGIICSCTLDPHISSNRFEHCVCMNASTIRPMIRLISEHLNATHLFSQFPSLSLFTRIDRSTIIHGNTKPHYQRSFSISHMDNDYCNYLYK